MKDCLFCGIVANKVTHERVYEDDQVVAFRDIHPQAPFHVLIIPREHISTLDQAEDGTLLGHLMLTAVKLAREAGFADSGYRVVINCNQEGGQTVYHLHAHLLAGRSLGWPPG